MCNEETKMRTVIKLMILISFIPAIFVYGCGGGSGSTDGISSGVTASGNTSLVQDDVMRTKGDISGIVDEKLLASMQCAADIKSVYIFQGHDASPDDIDINDPNPVQSATVVYNNVSRQYRYSVHSLSEGNYTFAFTCQAGKDSPEYDDDIRFGGMKNVTITGGKEVISHLFI
jgi:hypothetical protein